MMEGLSGKVAFVTGGGAGIGRAVAVRLATEGCHVGVIDIDRSRVDAVCEEVRKLGGRAAAATGDVSSAGAMRSAVEELSRTVGAADILVNNAGIARLGPLLEISEKDWRDHFHINVDGVWHTCRAVVPRMIERGRGVVVNMASWLGKRGWANYGAYCATKFAVIGLTQALAYELARHGIRVNAVCPGLIVGTPMREAIEAEAERLGLPQAKDRIAAIPLQRAGTPEDVARSVAFLASDEASYLTGTSIDVAGGLWMS
ncbi:MAG TPA: SDR family NAD(P)-dependent oxidoreductase [Gemmatimonadales bacterium]|nr:SDR family NAD(P)-dependent oxidoreductase [Gemmatimonadales bacterium]